MNLPAPWVERHDDMFVVRDDLLPGGSKARFVGELWGRSAELVYASPAQGGMQLALAYAARRLERRATIFVAKRKDPHPRTAEAAAVGARIEGVAPGYLAVVQRRARDYVARTPGARLLEFGGWSEMALERLAEAARSVDQRYGPFPQVWCAAGSGLLASALAQAMPLAEVHAVRVGRALEELDRSVIVHDVTASLRFEEEYRGPVPFPACPNYDAKAWAIAQRYAEPGALFWNVAGPSPTRHAAESGGMGLTSVR